MAEQVARVWIVPALKRKLATIAASDKINAQRLTLANTGASNETPKKGLAKDRVKGKPDRQIKDHADHRGGDPGEGCVQRPVVP